MPKLWNDIIQYQREMADIVDMCGAEIAKVLVIYYGGTIGMQRDEQTGYVPVKGHLHSVLAEHSSFHDKKFKEQIVASPQKSDKYLDSPLITPSSTYNKRILYRILEHENPLDSSNVTMADWSRIASVIGEHYSAFDAFVILHGTDTMCYTASALSFMLEGLGKTVIITGSQIPFSENRNDAGDNLLGALTIAGHYCIPEVGLYFNHRLFRGNRTTKLSTTDMQAFDSPNIKPLANVGVNIDVEWPVVLKVPTIPFVVHERLESDVGVIRFFPGIPAMFLKHAFAPGVKGIVLETFGAGNIPTMNQDILDVISEANQRGVVIVNVTQCYRGTVLDIYATGKALLTIGVVPGFDMTTECALAKLAFLLGSGMPPQQVRQRMMQNLRGELTLPVIGNNKDAAVKVEKRIYDKVVLPALLVNAAREGDLEELKRLLGTFKGHVTDAITYDDKDLLHVAELKGHQETIEYLMQFEFSKKPRTE